MPVPEVLISKASRAVRLTLAGLALSLLALAGWGCSPFEKSPHPPLPPTPTAPLAGQAVQFDDLTVTGDGVDRAVLEDIAAALQTGRQPVCAALQLDCRFPVQVEVFASQESFNRGAMNPEMKGYFAISGSHRIQMVSPANPAPHEISYSDGVQVAVHEYVHLVENEINPDLPLWLNEGTAVYIGPHDIYAAVCQARFPFDAIPAFAALESNYTGVPAADLFSYSLVEYLVQDWGLDALNELLRDPAGLEQITAQSKVEFEAGWLNYMRLNYHP